MAKKVDPFGGLNIFTQSSTVENCVAISATDDVMPSPFGNAQGRLHETSRISDGDKVEILRLTPQNDITTQCLAETVANLSQ